MASRDRLTLSPIFSSYRASEQSTGIIFLFEESGRPVTLPAITVYLMRQ